jgi:exodeoxyribonuclease III
MRLICWNVNGLRSIVGKGLPEIITRLNADCLCIQETKAQREQLTTEHTSPCSMQSYFSDSEKKGYSGVGTFFGENVKGHKLYCEGIGTSAIDREGRVIITSFLLGEQELYIANCYFPSGTSGEERQDFKYEFLELFLKFVEGLPIKVRKNLIVCGDFNICHREIDIHHPKEAERKELSGFLPNERKWIDRFIALGFVDSFRHCSGEKTDSYTWWTFRAGARQKNKGWRIDYFFVAEELKSRIKSAEIYSSVVGSDHCPILLELH